MINILGTGLVARFVSYKLCDLPHIMWDFGLGSGALTKAGPVYLWDNFNWKEFFSQIQLQKITVEIDNLEGYNRKITGVASKHPLCHGYPSFNCIVDGFQRLDALFPRDCQKAKNLESLLQHLTITTLPYGVFSKLRGQSFDTIERISYYGTSDESPPFPRHTLAYSGNAKWVRFFWQDNLPIYEFVKPVAGYRIFEKRITKVLRIPHIYPSTVIPIGRFAEGNSEILLSDVFRTWETYKEKIMQLVSE
jgi:hypothetical protein